MPRTRGLSVASKGVDTPMVLFKFSAPLFAIFLTLPALAATSSGWNSSPNWASEENRNPPPAQRKSLFSQDSRTPISPFSPGSNNFALDIGQVFLMGDLGTNYADSIGAQLHYTYGVSDLFGFDASIGYSDHADGEFSMTTAVAGLRTNLAWYDKVVPYLVFGLGFYRPSYQIRTAGPGGALSNITSTSPVLFGVHLGPGVDLELTKQLFFGASLTFHDVFGSVRTTAAGPLSVGGTFTSFLLHAGVSF